MRILRVSPNAQLNKRALEEESRPVEEMPAGTPEDTLRKQKEPAERSSTLEVQTQVDSSVLRGRKLKHRE